MGDWIKVPSGKFLNLDMVVCSGESAGGRRFIATCGTSDEDVLFIEDVGDAAYIAAALEARSAERKARR